MLSSKFLKNLLSSSILAVTLVMFGTNVHAASCKGQSRSVCSTTTDCYWVDGYKRKDGVKVSSHCRSKAGKASKSKKGKSASSGKSNKSHSKVKKGKQSKNKKSSDNKAKKTIKKLKKKDQKKVKKSKQDK